MKDRRMDNVQNCDSYNRHEPINLVIICARNGGTQAKPSNIHFLGLNLKPELAESEAGAFATNEIIFIM
jgi:hypothetical protein